MGVTLNNLNQMVTSQTISASQQATDKVSNQGLQVSPRFMFGFRADVSNNIHYIDDNTVVYPCGHNVVIYRIDDRSQRYIPGIQGTEGITAIAVSPSKKYLAICEKSSKAICSVINLQAFLHASRDKKIFVYDHNNKKKRTLIADTHETTEFHTVTFSGINEKLLATLTGGLQVMLWQWDKQRMIASGECGMIPQDKTRML